MGWALQMCCLWLEKTKSNRPWTGLEIPVHPNTTAMFALSIVTTVSNGQNTKFWTDHWLHGSYIEDLAPNVFKCVPMRLRKARAMKEALQDNTWVADIRGALGWHGLAEYQLWDILNEWNLDIPDDMHQWKFEISRILFSTRSAYRNFFIGSVTFELWIWKRLWKSWAPSKCKTFVWLAIRNRC